MFTPTTPLLQLSDLTLEHLTDTHAVRAVQRLNLTQAAGERVALLGPAGCGKSTLLQAVAGLLRPTQGQVRLDGLVVRGPGPERPLVQAGREQLLPWKTVLDNLMFPLLMGGCGARVGRSEARERALDVLMQLGIVGQADALPHQLPEATALRVALARALVTRPRLLLLDAPWAGLDLPARRRLQHELLALATDHGLALLMATRSVDEALALADRVIVLSPHLGRDRHELDARPYGPDSVGSPGFQAQARALQRQMFDIEAALV